MTVSVLTPQGEIYQGEAKSIRVPATDNGLFEVLDNHAPIVSSLEEGVVTLVLASDAKKEYSIQKGFIEVLNNNAIVLVEGVKEV